MAKIKRTVSIATCPLVTPGRLVFPLKLIHRPTYLLPNIIVCVYIIRNSECVLTFVAIKK